MIAMMNRLKITSVLLLIAALFLSTACDRNALSGSKVNKANYDQISMGMSKSQVETILGKPTTVDTKDMLIFKKTTYRFEDGEKFAMVTFKNDEVDGKDTNLDRERAACSPWLRDICLSFGARLSAERCSPAASRGRI